MPPRYQTHLPVDCTLGNIHKNSSNRIAHLNGLSYTPSPPIHSGSSSVQTVSSSQLPLTTPQRRGKIFTSIKRQWCELREVRQRTVSQLVAYTLILVFTFTIAVGLCLNLRQSSYEGDYWCVTHPTLRQRHLIGLYVGMVLFRTCPAPAGYVPTIHGNMQWLTKLDSHTFLRRY